MLEPPRLYILYIFVKAVIDFISESKYVTLTKVGLNFKGELQFWALVSCKWGSSPEPLNSKSNALPLGDYTPDYCCKVIRQTRQCNKYPFKPHFYMSYAVRKPDFCLCENKGADQLRSNCEADQRLCFRYSDSTIPLLLKSKISNF